MSFSDSMVGISVDYSAAQINTAYSLSLAKKAMDQQEQSAEKLLDMLPKQTQPVPLKGQYFNAVV